MPRKRQPVRVAGGQPYGDRKALEELQQQAPMQAGPSVPVAAPSGASMAGGAFQPTVRPAEPVTAGIPTGPGPAGSSWYLREDPQMLLRAAYEANPDPWILRLLQDEPAPDPFFKPVAAQSRFNPAPPVLRPAP